MAKTILVAGAFLIGQWLDKKYSSQPLFTLVFVLAAIILGIVWLIHLVNSSQD
jgi:F0F1-type ATP synthase assembly protein I